MKKTYYIGLIAVLLTGVQIGASQMAERQQPSVATVFGRIADQLNALRLRKNEIEQTLRVRGGDELVNYFRLRVLQQLALNEEKEKGWFARRPAGKEGLMRSDQYKQLLRPLSNRLLELQLGVPMSDEKRGELEVLKGLIDRYLEEYYQTVLQLSEEFPTSMNWQTLDVPAQEILSLKS